MRNIIHVRLIAKWIMIMIAFSCGLLLQASDEKPCNNSQKEDASASKLKCVSGKVVGLSLKSANNTRLTLSVPSRQSFVAMTFVMNADTWVGGQLTMQTHVTVRYRQDGRSKIAVYILAPPSPASLSPLGATAGQDNNVEQKPQAPRSHVSDKEAAVTELKPPHMPSGEDQTTV